MLKEFQVVDFKHFLTRIPEKLCSFGVVLRKAVKIFPPISMQNNSVDILTVINKALSYWHWKRLHIL